MKLWREPDVRLAFVAGGAVTAVLCGVAFYCTAWAALLVLTAGLCWGVLFLLLTRRRIRAIARLAESVDRVLHGADDTRIEACNEGELSVLASEVQKMTVRLREQAEHLQKDRLRMSDALADISHQLRTPLTSMNLTVSMLSKSDLSQQERYRLLFELKQRLGRIDWLIETLLKLSRLDAGTVVFRREAVRVEELIRAALAPLSVTLELREQAVSVSVGDACFFGDIAWSVEAIGNLLKNCSEHTPAGGQIFVSARETALFCELVIRDTGAGFEPAEIPYLFDRFYRGSNATAESVGIGLSLARTVIVSQNGTVSAANAPNGGAMFTVRFYKSTV